MKHTFSVEIISKEHVRSMSISESRNRVLFEGNLGEFVNLSLEEGDVLEFTGVNGVLRINLTYDQLRSFFKKMCNQASSLGERDSKHPP